MGLFVASRIADLQNIELSLDDEPRAARRSASGCRWPDAQRREAVIAPRIGSRASLQPLRGEQERRASITEQQRGQERDRRQARHHHGERDQRAELDVEHEAREAEVE